MPLFPHSLIFHILSFFSMDIIYDTLSNLSEIFLVHVSIFFFFKFRNPKAKNNIFYQE